ncbi:MAG: formimidoylglutamate deiminase [Allosphingosinicella sp.]
MDQSVTTILHFRTAFLPTGWATDVRVTLRDGLIETVVAGEPSRNGDERHAIGLPGVANLHSHAFQRGMAGLTETRGASDDSFWTWRETMYRFVDRIGPDELQAVAALAYVEMLETGFTRVGEFHYLHHDVDGTPFGEAALMSQAIVAAADETRIGLTHLPVFYAHGGFGGEAPGHGQRRFLHDVDGFAGLLESARGAAARLPDAVVGIAPHSLRAATPDELRQLEELAGEGPIHIHIAEQVKEVEECLAWSGARPVEWLLANLPVDPRWCLVHATHMTAEETDALARSGAVAGLCPITEANLGDGLFPAVDFLAAGGRFGVGSDSNVLIDLAEELRLLEYGQRLVRRGRNVLAGGAGRSTGEDLFAATVTGGAQALGVESGLIAGRPADLISLDGDNPGLVGRSGGAILDSFLFAAGRSAIDCVWRRGRKLVEDGNHVDGDAIRARYRRTLELLLA